MVKNLSIMILISMISLIGCKKYEAKRGYGDVAIIIESTKQGHSFGKSIPIKVSVKNNGKKPFVFDTKGKPLRIYPGSPVTPLGLSEPRPVYDLIFMGSYLDESGMWKEYVWLLSQQRNESVPAGIILQSNETKTLIEAIWEPPKVRYMQGGFVIRFADVEFDTGIGIESPRR